MRILARRSAPGEDLEIGRPALGDALFNAGQPVHGLDERLEALGAVPNPGA